MTRVLDRRSLLRGAGGVAIALPLLDAMVPLRRASAATTSPQRFIVYYSPGGTDMPSWRPTGSETQFTLGASLQALERLKQQLIVLSGIDMKVTSQGVGHPHAPRQQRHDERRQYQPEELGEVVAAVIHLPGT